MPFALRCLVVAGLLLGVAGAATATAAPPPPASVFEDDALLLRSGREARDRALDEMAAMGVDVVRVMLVWRSLAPRPAGLTAPRGSAAEPGAAALATIQDLAAAASARGLRLLVTLTGPGPAWASRCRGPVAVRQLCRPDPVAFGRFVAAVGRALPGRRLWSIWNEPNAGTWLTPQLVHGRLVSPALYRALVVAGTHALNASGHHGDPVLVGETAPIGHAGGPEATRPTAPRRFLRALLCGLRRGRCAPLPGTGLAHHVYPTATQPSPCAPSAPGQYGPSGLGDLQRLVRVAAARGLTRGRLPVWITESGVQTDPPDRLFGVPLAQQAADVNELEWLATGAGVASVAQYLLFDELRTAGFQSGLRFAGGQAKPALDAYMLPVWVTRLRRGGVRIWGRVRAAPAGPVAVAVAVAVEHRPRGSTRWRVVRTVPAAAPTHIVRLTLRIAAGGRWRLRAAGHASRTAVAAAPCPVA